MFDVEIIIINIDTNVFVVESVESDNKGSKVSK